MTELRQDDKIFVLEKKLSESELLIEKSASD